MEVKKKRGRPTNDTRMRAATAMLIACGAPRPKLEIPPADAPRHKKIPPPPTHPKISAEEVRKLRGINVTMEEAATYFGVAKGTFERVRRTDPAVAQAWEDGFNSARMSLRRLQWQHAQMANSSGVTMTIHLSKHWLGETERSITELQGAGGGPIQFDTAQMKELLSKLNVEELEQLESLARKLGGRVPLRLVHSA